jgi:hypothetical protein
MRLEDGSGGRTRKNTMAIQFETDGEPVNAPASVPLWLGAPNWPVGWPCEG